MNIVGFIVLFLILFVTSFAGVYVMSMVAPQNSDFASCLRISILVTLAEIVVAAFNIPTMIAGMILVYFNIKDFGMDPLPAFLATGIFVLIQGVSVVFLVGLFS